LTRRWFVSKPGKLNCWSFSTALTCPFNTNSSAQDVRIPVTVRKISGGSQAKTADDATILPVPEKDLPEQRHLVLDLPRDRLGIAANSVDRLPDIIRRYTADVRA